MRRTRIDAEDADSDCSMASCSSMEVVSQEEPEEMRVLAVDDNKIDRRLIEMLLKTSAFQVTAVSSAKKALELLGLSGKGSSPREGNDLDFDLIITDYCMPEMTGYDLLMRVKEDSSAWKDIPVVVMSSENRSSRINRCMAEGAQEFLIKPVQLTDVQRLKGHIRAAKELRGNMSSSVSAKRKSSASSSLPAQGLERRARLSELTVA